MEPVLQRYLPPIRRMFTEVKRTMRFSGATVVTKHKAALSACKDKVGWDLLSCIVDNMGKEYGHTPLGL